MHKYLKSGSKITDNITLQKTAMGKLAGELNVLSRGFTRLQMNFLGTLFLGMWMQRTFGGLVNGALGMTGILDLLGMAFNVFMLPIVQVLMPGLIWLSNWLIHSPKWFKLLVGGLVVFGAALGTVLMVVSQLALGLSALIAITTGKSLFIGGLATSLRGLLGLPPALAAGQTSLTAFGATAGTTSGGLTALAAPLIYLAVLVAALAIAWTFNFANIRGYTKDAVSEISASLNGLSTALQGVNDLFIGLSTQNEDQFLESYLKIVEGLQTFTFNIMKVPTTVLEYVENSMLEVLKWLITLPEFINRIITKIAGESLTNSLNNLTASLTGPLNVSLFKEGSELATNKETPNFISKLTNGGKTPLLSSLADFIFSGGKIPAFASGGLISRPTLALVGERGPEMIVPMRSSGNSITMQPNITIYANVASDIDIEHLARKISDTWNMDLRRNLG
jgi:hypothetical protein